MNNITWHKFVNELRIWNCHALISPERNAGGYVKEERLSEGILKL